MKQKPLKSVEKVTTVTPVKDQPPNIRPVNTGKPNAVRPLFGGLKRAVKPKSRTSFRQKFLKKMKSMPLYLKKHRRISSRPASFNPVNVQHNHAVHDGRQVDGTSKCERSDYETGRERLILVFKWNISEMQYRVSR